MYERAERRSESASATGSSRKSKTIENASRDRTALIEPFEAFCAQSALRGRCGNDSHSRRFWTFATIRIDVGASGRRFLRSYTRLCYLESPLALSQSRAISGTCAIGEIARDWLSATGDPDYDSRVYERTERLSEATSAIGTVAKLQNHRECEPLPHRPLWSPNLKIGRFWVRLGKRRDSP